ncbi:thiamine pyrophosphate-dependent enzyme [Cumulibacter soli]|uniref:thiamine pyrophosphate-dependent enzyme n=1 Tax=Cumulibacter soli TaxID=2546344 RepID=UPI001067A406|nr:thiamine pyrophosphate-dependent enzyme [Cumulibacter soli]
MSARVDRRAFVHAFVAGLESDALVISGLGSPTYDLFAAGERPGNFYLWGAMGGAVPMGLGLALAQPRRPVVVLTGDGEQLMGIGSLATVGVQQPANLTIVVLDNGLYGETGGQRSHAGHATDLAAVAAACGIADVRRCDHLTHAGSLADAAAAMAGPVFARVLVDASEQERVLPPRDGAANKIAFRAALGLSTF